MNNRDEENKKMIINKKEYKSISFGSIDAFILQLKRDKIDHNKLKGASKENFSMILEELRVYLIEQTKIKDWPILKEHLAKWFPEYDKKDLEEDKNAKRIIIWEMEKIKDE